MASLSAAPVPAVGAGRVVAGKSLESLIQDLSADEFRSREEASHKLWEIGGAALSALEAVSNGKDPEQAHRARELIWKIQLNLTPETDPAVIHLVEQYFKASPEAKVNFFNELRGKRAWWQMLKLYASETDVELQQRLQQTLRTTGGQQGISGLAVIAAREKLLLGDAKSAREFLEMAPADAAGLLALADFHRSQGTLEAELDRSKKLNDKHGTAWQLALHRAAGRLEAAKVSADAAGETKMSAMISLLRGDPLPWMKLEPDGRNGDSPLRTAYTALAIQRWQGKPGNPAEDARAILAVKTRSQHERLSAINAVFLLGHRELGEAALVRESPLDTFIYLEAMELVPEALKALGLDPAKPDYNGYVAERFKSFSSINEKGEEPDEEAAEEGSGKISPQETELIALADFLERRGLQTACDDAYLAPLAAMAKADEEAFVKLLAKFLGVGSTLPKPQAASQIARQAATAWAGDKPERWQEVITSISGGDAGRELWSWLEEINPTAPLSERFDGFLALCGIGRDPRHLSQKWQTLGWDHLAKLPLDKRPAATEGVAKVFENLPTDAATYLKLWDLTPPADQEKMHRVAHTSYLSTAGRWSEAAEFYLKHIKLSGEAKQEPQLYLIASAAAYLRKAGRIAEAAVQDTRVDQLALGNDAASIASAYGNCGDYSRAALWWQRAAIQCSLDESESFAVILQQLLPELLEQGKWQEAAAAAEAFSQLSVQSQRISYSSLGVLNFRLQSDLARALANLKTDRPAALALLDQCRTMLPSDGSLADDFFPALRRVGLMKQHDAWFEDSWRRITAVVAQYPDSDNTCNTAAWLAARGQRRLDEAEKLEQHALALNPNQPAYLDTMAEIHFVKGNREKALEWSKLAVNFDPTTPPLRRQQDRFRTAPLPR
jgi:tetratricopeptide (TPR) repeat protein